MASELKVDKFTGVTTAGSINVTSGSTTTNLQQGLTKAWFNLNAATPALRDSFNITNVTDEGTGFYEGNFTSAMSNGNYSVSGSMSTKSSGNSYSGILTTGDESDTYGLHSTASIRVNLYANNFSTQKDPSMAQANINGDLA